MDVELTSWQFHFDFCIDYRGHKMKVGKDQGHVQRAWNPHTHTPNKIEIRISRIFDWNLVLGRLRVYSKTWVWNTCLWLLRLTTDTDRMVKSERESFCTWTWIYTFGLRGGFVEWAVIVRDRLGTTSRLGISRVVRETSTGPSSISFLTSSIESRRGGVAWANRRHGTTRSGGGGGREQPWNGSPIYPAFQIPDSRNKMKL